MGPTSEQALAFIALGSIMFSIGALAVQALRWIWVTYRFSPPLRPWLLLVGFLLAATCIRYNLYVFQEVPSLMNVLRLPDFRYPPVDSSLRTLTLALFNLTLVVGYEIMSSLVRSELIRLGYKPKQ